MSSTAHAHFTIGTLSRQTDVAIDTIRYYERQELLPPPKRRASGYREYDAGDIERILFIRRAKGLGFTLDEIRDLLVLESDEDRGVEGVKNRANRRLADLDRAIVELTEKRDQLAHLVAACPGHGAPKCCPILSSMHGVEGDIPADARNRRE